ncbi:MAG: hypothetical protein B7Z63_05850 [Ignavibacteriae bacterium 37-53-5]|nr:MAG: hypothetical protein B7Z63_05850 [Ignavibacteriae bacterium 37-53-5]
MLSAPELRIGTSGWNYSHWRQIFYPHGVKQAQWLSFYASNFDTVEINATFYRLPKPEYVDNWAASVPEGFVFAVGDPWLYNEYFDNRKLPASFDNQDAARSLFKWLLSKAHAIDKD